MREHYVIELGREIDTAERLFSAFTDTACLGFSGLDDWDRFYDTLVNGLSGRDVVLTVEIADDFPLWAEVKETIHWIADALLEDCPDQVNFVWPHQ